MEKIIRNEEDQEFWQDPAWVRALSLTERTLRVPASNLQKARIGIPTAEEEAGRRAMSRFTTWKAQPPFDKGTSFVERLACENFTEEEFLAILAEPQESLQSR